MTNLYTPIILKITEEDRKRITNLAELQRQHYGHDSGYFHLGRSDSSHEIGFEGEIGLIRYFKDNYNLIEPQTIGLELMGSKFDVYIVIKGINYKLHVKTGRWTNWPEPERAFGIHYWQQIELDSSPIILISLLKNDYYTIRIEGYITSDFLHSCPIIKKNEFFPGMSYPSRTDNRLTFFHQYQPINTLFDYLTLSNKLPSSPPIPLTYPLVNTS